LQRGAPTVAALSFSAAAVLERVWTSWRSLRGMRAAFVGTHLKLAILSGLFLIRPFFGRIQIET
jgi:hypothetical protein